jgi:hypothetical protein
MLRTLVRQAWDTAPFSSHNQRDNMCGAHDGTMLGIKLGLQWMSGNMLEYENKLPAR